MYKVSLKTKEMASKLLLGLMLLFTFNSLFAGIDPQLSRIETAPSATPLSLLDVDGIKTSVSSDAPIGLSPDKIHNRITMYTNPNYTVFFGTAMDIEVTMQVKKYTYASDLTPAQTESVVLTIKYDPFSGTQYIHSQGVRDFGYRKMELELTEIKVDNVSQDELPALVIIDAEIISLKHTTFTFPTDLELEYTVQNLGCVDKPTNLHVEWDDASSDGAIEYQLEWLHINDYGPIDYTSTPVATILDEDELYYNFKFNSTRITTTDNSYDISLIFDRGHVLFRVRAVGIDLNGNYLFGPWTPVNQEGTVDAFPSANRYHIDQSASHEQLLNWQYAATYAEDGKRKEVISYFDGSLRNRQTVTMINSDENVIVGETIYDHQGRPSITVLPAPVPACDSLTPQVIQFFPNFNRNSQNTPYNRYNFDTVPNAEATCELEAEGMSTSSGAAHYYSNFNPNQLGPQAYVPSSQVALGDTLAYPFVQVEYTPDNTGRVRRQGGVGPDYQMGSGHETQYIYSAPNQVELDRLFGSEVGYAAHYKKNTVVDAHGQASISYLDQEGRVIATALAGPAPENLQAIASEAGAEVALTIDAFDGIGLNNTNEADESIVFSRVIGVSYESEFSFTYSLTVSPFTSECVPDICFECVYDLTYELIDECGNNRFDSLPPMVGRFSLDSLGQPVFHAVCESEDYALLLPDDPESTSFSTILGVGYYQLNKKLKINLAAKAAFIESYLANDTCLLSLDDFIAQALLNVNFEDCDLDCESCLEQLGTSAEYVANGGSLFDYNAEYELCMELCNEGNPYSFCDISLGLMIADMMPNGQYGQVYNTEGEVVSNANNLSIYNLGNILPNTFSPATHYTNPALYDRETGAYKLGFFEANGDSARVILTLTGSTFFPLVDDPNTNVKFDAASNQYYCYPQHLALLSDFVERMNYSWARSLVVHHPEFCSYLKCIGVEDYEDNPQDFYSSVEFDNLLFKTNTLADAQDAGLIPTVYQDGSGYFDLSTLDWFTGTNAENTPKDPFGEFASDISDEVGEGDCSLDDLTDRFENYLEINGTMYSMPEVAAFMARCADNFYTSYSTGCFNFGGDVPLGYVGDETELHDKEWQLLKSMYLSTKQQYLTDFLDCTAGRVCGYYTGCIGNENYNPFADFSSTSGVFSLLNPDFFDANQPCGFFNFSEYQSLQRRFTSVEDALPFQGPNEIAYNVYLQTGQCPVPFALQNFMNQLAQNGDFSTAVPLLNVYSGLSAVFQAGNNFNMPGTIPYLAQVITLNTATNLTVRWMEGISTHTVLSFTKSSTIPWSDLTQFLNFTSTSPTAFTVVGYNSSNVPVQITGSFSGPFTLEPCNFYPVGTQNALGSDLQFLLNALASSSNLTATSGILVTPLTISSTPVQVVGSNISNLFSAGSELSWASISATEYELKNINNTCERYLLNFTSYPSGLDPDDIILFENLVSTGVHTFSVVAHTATQTYTLEGSVTFNNCGNIIGVPQGNFDLPTPMLCISSEHEATQILVDVLEYMFQNQDITDSINLLLSPFMAAPLTAQFFPADSTTSEINGEFTQMLFSLGVENCDITLEVIAPDSIPSGATAPKLTEITSIVSFYTTGQTNFFNHYTELILNVTFDNDSFPTGQIRLLAPCLNLQSCDPCPDEFIFELPETMGEFLSAKASVGEIVVDESISQYNFYVSKVSAYNTDHSLTSSDSTYITALSYEDFLKYGYDYSGFAYKNFLTNMKEDVDGDKYLRDPMKFMLEQGTASNVLFEHERYVKALTLYNDRASEESLPALVPLSKEEFAFARLASGNQLYISYLEFMPQDETPAEDILEFLEVDTSNLIVNGNDSLYALYVSAYFEFLADSANYQMLCSRKDIVPTLHTFEDMDQAYLFCSEDAKQIVLDYITNLQGSCAGELPVLRACDVTKQSQYLEEQRFYLYYLNLLNDFNNTLWSSENGVEMNTPYSNKNQFWMVYERGLVLGYADYLSQYQDVTENVASNKQYEPLDLEIYKFYYEAMSRGEDSSCTEEFMDYLDCWNYLHDYYEDSLDHLPEFRRFSFNIISATMFMEMELCDCVAAFCDSVNYLVSNNIIPSADYLTSLLKFENICPEEIEYKPSSGVVKIEEPCKNDYLNYNTCFRNFIVYFEANLAELEEFESFVFYVYEYDEFVKYNFCYCVDEMCAQLQAIIDGIVVPTPEMLYEILSMKSLCKNPCTPTVPDQIPLLPPTANLDMDTLGPCERLLYNHAVFEAMNNYQNYLDSVVGTISQMYVNHCLGVTETLTYTYQDKQYHYTLYYYDQAGNLIKTIPPAGVQQLDITASNSPLSIACKNDRLNNTKNVFTRHRLPTRYEYNSLNQLVGQNTPDTDPMNIFEPSLPNGLHPQLITNKIQMVTEAVGYLAGYVTVGSNDIGYLYKTNDAGNTWSRVHGIAGVDFKDVLMISNSTGYAVGAPGLLFKTQDGGQNWMLQNFWIQQNSGEVRSLNALAFESNTLIIAGDDGMLVNLNTSTNTYTFISGVSADVDFTAVTVISGTYYLSANHTDGYGLVYEFDGSTTPTAMTEYNPTQMRHIDVQSGTAYLAGDDGRIYVKPDAWNTTTDVWIEKESRLIGNIQKIVAFSDMQMLALVDEKVWRTIDAGLTWSVASGDYTILDIHKAADGKSALAIGQNAYSQVISYFVPNATNNFGAAQTQNMPMTLGANPIDKVWHHTLTNGGQNKTLIAYVSDNTLYFTKNGLVSNPVWTSHSLATSLDVVDVKFIASGSYGAPELKGLVLLSDGSLIRIATTATSVVSSTGVANDVAAIANKGTHFRTITITGERKDWSIADNGTVSLMSSGDPQSISGLVNNLEQGNILVCNGDDNIIVSDFTYRVDMDLTASYDNITTQTRNTKLWALITNSGTEVILSGNTGALYVLESGVWMQQNTNRKDHFYALEEHNGQIYSAGQNGHFSRGFVFSGNYSNSYLLSTQTGSVTQHVSQDFYAIGSNGDNMYVVGAGGKIAYSPNATNNNFSISTFGTKNLNAVCAVGTQGHVLVMGNESSYYRTNSASAISNKNIHVPALSDVNFSSISTGYVVGGDFTVRRTNNAGSSWNTIRPSTLSSVATNFDLHLVHCVSYNDAYILGQAGAARVNAPGVATAVPSFATNIRAIDAQNSKLIALSGNNTIHRYTLSSSGISFVSTITGSGIYNAIAYQSTDNVMAVGMSAIFHYYAADNTPITVTTPTPMQITGDMRAIDVKGSYIVVAGDNGKYFRMTSSGMNTDGEHQNIEWIEMDGIYLSGSDLYRNPSTWESYITAANQINIRSVSIASATQVVYGGNYNAAFFSTTGLTSSNVQYPYVRTAFDPGDRYSSLFFYDKLGRLVVSQNARQRNTEDRRFSYTVYDSLGRVIEVGEKFENETLADGTLGVFYFRDIFGSMVSGHYNPKVIDDNKLLAWIGGDGARNEVTRSYYDVFRDDFYTTPFAVNQDNQRKRIAHVAYYSTWDDAYLVAVEEYDHATHFIYDIHGNVTKLMQDNRKMSEDFISLADHRIKTMEYSYDLVSGNVHRMSVQTGEADQWHHAYTYDADNRITEVYTSTQTPLLDISYPSQSLTNELAGNSDWTLEANYFYYAHGPLARTELGNELQGLDYIYNLQGWLKGVNATSLDNALDPGGDGTGSFSKDVMAFSLHYYDGDYTPIGGVALNPACSIAYSSAAAAHLYDDPLNPNDDEVNLYNGNIRFMQTTLTDIPTRDALPMLNAYKYDQLNRLLESRSYTDGLSSNTWNPTTYGDKYFNAFTYDANGNILTQKRHNAAGDIWEDLTYHYLVDGSGNLVRNRLYHVRDYAGVTSPTYNNPSGTMSSQMDANNSDLNDQGQFIDASIFEVENDNNYKYDEEGRLIQDLAEGIENIVWRVDGKVKKVIFTSVSGKNNLEFDYDAFGRRIAKHVWTQGDVLVKSTYYILDAQGNQLSTYEHVVEDEQSNYQLAERVIYGSSRLGINVNKVDLLDETQEDYLNLTLGNKLFEMSNHLGNVLTVINDIKIPVSSNSVDVDGYLATIVSTADYSPFGVQLDGRTVSAESYRWGYQGSEKDDEIKGEGNSYTTEFRMLDPRLGRWLSIDPLAAQFPWQSPYVSMDNNPICLNDIFGLSTNGEGEPEPIVHDNVDPSTSPRSLLPNNPQDGQMVTVNWITSSSAISQYSVFTYNSTDNKWSQTVTTGCPTCDFEENVYQGASYPGVLVENSPSDPIDPIANVINNFVAVTAIISEVQKRNIETAKAYKLPTTTVKLPVGSINLPSKVVQPIVQLTKPVLRLLGPAVTFFSAGYHGVKAVQNFKKGNKTEGWKEVGHAVVAVASAAAATGAYVASFTKYGGPKAAAIGFAAGAIVGGISYAINRWW
jgi:RHS repeat-associated protein